jgi:hypothetical protein
VLIGCALNELQNDCPTIARKMSRLGLLRQGRAVAGACLPASASDDANKENPLCETLTSS